MSEAMEAPASTALAVVPAEAAQERQQAEDARLVVVREREQAEARAVKAEQDRAETEVRAEAARVATEQRAEAARVAAAEQAERDKAEAVAAEQRRVAAVKDAEEAEAKRRAENKAHRAKINRAILDALTLLGLAEEPAKAVIGAVARGEVPHMTIGY